MKSRWVLLSVLLQTGTVLASNAEVKTVYSIMGGSYLEYIIRDVAMPHVTDAHKLNSHVHYAQLATKTMTDVLDQVNAGEEPKYSKLKTGVLLSFPSTLRSVKDVANYYLTIAGYALVIPADDPQATGDILLRRPSDLANTGKLSTVEKALLLVSGTDTRLLVDHNNYYVTFVKAAQ